MSIAVFHMISSPFVPESYDGGPKPPDIAGRHAVHMKHNQHAGQRNAKIDTNAPTVRSQCIATVSEGTPKVDYNEADIRVMVDGERGRSRVRRDT
jgi:hypothetical protein